MTICGESQDIDPSLLDKMEAFLTAVCVAGVFSLERGGTMSHLHLQGIVKMRM